MSFAHPVDLESFNKIVCYLTRHCIPNKMNEVNFKILHKMYPVNDTVVKYMDVESSCSFYGNKDETRIHLFFQCVFFI